MRVDCASWCAAISPLSGLGCLKALAQCSDVARVPSCTALEQCPHTLPRLGRRRHPPKARQPRQECCSPALIQCWRAADAHRKRIARGGLLLTLLARLRQMHPRCEELLQQRHLRSIKSPSPPFQHPESPRAPRASTTSLPASAFPTERPRPERNGAIGALAGGAQGSGAAPSVRGRGTILEVH